MGGESPAPKSRFRPALLADGRVLTLLLISLFGMIVFHRLLREREVGLVVSLGCLQGLTAALLLANALPTRPASLWWLPCGLLGLALLVRTSPGWQWSLSRRWSGILALSALVVASYTHYSQVRFLDTDNWVHEPLVALYQRGHFPPVHPYFPEIALHGHYGRDLLIARCAPLESDPLRTVWAFNVLTQVSSFLGFFFLALRQGARPLSGWLCSMFLFFGVCLGSRVGMADAFDGNNGLVYALLALLFYHLGSVLEWTPSAASRWPRCLLAALTLGIFAIVYESHFGLLLLTGLSMGLARPRRRVWTHLVMVAVLALGMAMVQGGPLTDVWQHRHRPLTEVEQNQGQHVSMTFPKAHLFQILVNQAQYQRLSVAYQCRLFSGFTPRISGEGYLSIFDPRFWQAHWLPLYFSPLVGWWAWRRRQALALAFWSFAGWAYLVPALVDFGPLYEREYLRWEFAASWGFAAALGLALGDCLGAPGGLTVQSLGGRWLRIEIGPRGWLQLMALGVLGGGLAPGEKLLNDALIDTQRHHLVFFPDADAWRLSQPELGLAAVDLKAMHRLSALLQGQHARVLTNLGQETPQGLWPDSVLATLTGACPAGHAHPPETGTLHARPNFDRDSVWRVFTRTGRLDVLQGAGISWVLLDPDRLGFDPRSLSQAEWFQVGEQRRLLAPVPAASSPQASGPPLWARVQLPPDALLRTRTLYPLRVQLSSASPGSRLRLEVLHSPGLRPASSPVEVEANQAELEHYLVTPLEEGDFLVRLSRVGQSQPLWEQPIHLDLTRRLGALQIEVDLPPRAERQALVPLHLKLTSAVGVQAGQDYTVAYRLRNQQGRIMFQWDAIQQPIDLDLPAGQTSEQSFQLFTPNEPGTFTFELLLRHRLTGETIPLPLNCGPLQIP